eukprot:gb/GFBE01059645.1/.p1 GENE.gb/GFBE01059645.1/~~gb/GFBE01059645.1/.p1  ORF type:complete len:148 (+),score=13.89 gb/GFBE01059645.1/:1-444(+)
MLFNMGPHIHSLDTFKRYWGGFADYMDRTRKANTHRGSRMMFRASASGHINCDQYKRPFRSPKDFIPTSMYDWDRYAEYNAHVLQEFSKSEPWKYFRSTYLDVVPMTMLRPDGHFEGQYHDCLHYFLPGVVDWWSHLFVTQLLEQEP